MIAVSFSLKIIFRFYFLCYKNYFIIIIIILFINNFCENYFNFLCSGVICFLSYINV